MSGTEIELPQSLHIEEAPPPTEEQHERARNPRDVTMEAIARRYEEQTLAHELDQGAAMARDAEERDSGAAEEPPLQPTHAQSSAAPQSRTITLQGQLSLPTVAG